MFTTDAKTGYSYFRPGSLQPLHIFETIGVLIALALYNGIVLPINMPLIFYKLLSEKKFGRCLSTLGHHQISDAWPLESRSLKTVLEEDVPGLEFVFPLEANGVRLSVRRRSSRNEDFPHTLEITSAHDVLTGEDIDVKSIGESWPGWQMQHISAKPAEVTTENRAEYVASYARHLIFDAVAPQWLALHKGFHSSAVIDHASLSTLPIHILKRLAEGSSQLDVNELIATAQYDGYDARSHYIHWFWNTVLAWPPTKQKQLLKFVTAAERIPITGARSLTFLIKRSTPDNIESLPTSSTCFGTLMLPRYASKEILAAKLSLALKYGAEGFGTG